MRILAFDFETVADANAGRRAWGFEGTDAEVRAQMRALRLEESGGKNDFPKAAFQQIVAVGAVALDLGKRARIKATASPDEPELVRGMDAAIGQVAKTRLVSWNGNSFDLSVLRYRAMLHAVALPALYGPPDQRNYDSYLYRYGECHIDLMDVLGGFGASTSMKLAECARINGLPAKTVADGSQVEALVDAGDWATLQTYVEEDALITACLYLRWELSRSRMCREEFDTALEHILTALDDRQPAVANAIDGWRLEALAAATP